MYGKTRDRKKNLQDPHVAQENIYSRNESPASRELTRSLMEHTLSSEDGEILTDSWHEIWRMRAPMHTVNSDFQTK